MGNHTLMLAIIIELTLLLVARSSRTTSFLAENWCKNPETMQVGDFNGNGFDDWLCYDSENTHWKILDSAIALTIHDSECFASLKEESISRLERLDRFCTAQNEKLYIGDFNGDNRDDLLCHDRVGQSYALAMANIEGNFNGPSWKESTGFCGGFQDTLLAGDFNGDGYADVACHRSSDGYLWVSITPSNGTFGIPGSWDHDLNVCVGSNNLYVGDFNGDKLDDILCHNSSGRISIAFALNNENSFSGFSQFYYLNTPWCAHVGSVFMVGYVNNDTLADIICHDIMGRTWTLINHQSTNRFHVQIVTTFVYCPGDLSYFHIGSFTASESQQFLCTSNPVEWRILSNFLDP